MIRISWFVNLRFVQVQNFLSLFSGRKVLILILPPRLAGLIALYGPFPAAPHGRDASLRRPPGLTGRKFHGGIPRVILIAFSP